MTERRASADSLADALPLHVRAVGIARSTLFSRLPRLYFFAGLSIGFGIVLLVAKIGLMLAAPDWFLLANIAFVAGTIAVKIHLLRRRFAIRRLDVASARRAETRVYASTGLAIVLLSALYLLVSTPALFGSSLFADQGLWAGVSIAVLAFSELGISLVSTVAGRHDAAPLASAIRRTNLATAIIMLALAQSALVSAVGVEGSRTATCAAVGFGAAAALVGVGMLVRARRPQTTAP